MTLKAPFPYFGGKRSVADMVWQRFGTVKQYIEPFCGSAAILLAAPEPASLEVVGDANGFIANFWRAVKHQPAAVAEWADYPVSHIDLGARHRWMMDQRRRLEAELQDCDWQGDAKCAGWWLWGQCCWIGSGWCDWQRREGRSGMGQVPHIGNAGMGVQAAGRIPHISDAGMGVQAAGRIPHISDAGRGVQAAGKVPHISNAGMGEHLLTSGGRAAWVWLHTLAERLGRVRVIHGDWQRGLNHHYGAASTAVFLDPPYRAFEGLYGVDTRVADEVAAWAADNARLRIALCGHIGDYDLPGWDAVEWTRAGNTYGGSGTKDQECIWFSPACLPAEVTDLFALPPAEDPVEARIRDMFAEPEA